MPILDIPDLAEGYDDLQTIKQVARSYELQVLDGNGNTIKTLRGALAAIDDEWQGVKEDLNSEAAGTAAGRSEAGAIRAELAASLAEDATYDYWPANATELSNISGMTAGQKAVQRDTQHVHKFVGGVWVDQGLAPSAFKLSIAAYDANFSWKDFKQRLRPKGPRSTKPPLWEKVIGGKVVERITADGKYQAVDASPAMAAVQATVGRVAPLGKNRLRTQFVVGTKVMYGVDLAGVFQSSHTHAEFASITVLQGKVPRLAPLGRRLRRTQFVCGTSVLAALGLDGMWQSTHTHAEFASLGRAARKAMRTKEWLCWPAVVGGKDQVMIHDGKIARQLTDGAFTWKYPEVATGASVRCLADKSTGTLEPHTILGSGEVFAERSVVQHKVVVGQSLSLGARGFVTDADGNVLFADGVSGTVFNVSPSRFGDLALMFSQVGLRVIPYNNPPGASGGASTDALPSTSLLADFTVLKEEFGKNNLGETICSGFANAMLQWCAERGNSGRRMLFSVAGRGGTPYSGLKKGTTPYAAALLAVDQGKAVSTARGWKYLVTSMSILHGEAQSGSTAAEYAAILSEWRSDFQADVLTRVPGNPTIPAFISQMAMQGANNMVEICVGQRMAHDADANVVCVGPKYQFRYYDPSHPLAEAYVKLGELEALAERHWLAGRKFQPLRMVSAVLSGTTITVTFNNDPAGDPDTSAVPVGALALDISGWVTNPGNHGFELSTFSQVITSVTLGGDGKSVVLGLNGVPPGGTLVHYALQTGLEHGLNKRGARGTVHAGARITSEFDGLPIYDWALADRISLT